MPEVQRVVFEQVEERAAPGVTWVRALADLDLATLSSGGRELSVLCAGRTRWLLVEIGPGCFVDLRGSRMLLEVACALRDRDGRLLLVSDSAQLRRVLEAMDVDGDLPLVGSVPEALEEVGRGGHRRAEAGP